MSDKVFFPEGDELYLMKCALCDRAFACVGAIAEHVKRHKVIVPNFEFCRITREDHAKFLH